MGFSRCFVALLIAGVLVRSATAGGGPENVAVIVNSASADSKTIANHYIHLRQIPLRNVIYLDWQGSRTQVDFAKLRAEILLPVFQQIRQRGLDRQIDCLAYSCDFPTRIGEPELKRSQPRQLSPFASLTGATYLCRLWDVPLDDYKQQLFRLNNNFYCQAATPELESIATRSFRATDHWLPGGIVDEKAGAQYVLSMMLGATLDEGNTVGQILRYLRTSATADGTRPTGTIYFMKNSNVRSKTRQPLFDLAIRELEKLGVAAEIHDGILPQGKSDVAGLMAGSATFHWSKSESRILPGAFCEHLTSFGGVLNRNSGQTTLSAFLRNGAAAATGTIDEPYAIQAKFPLPTLHVHYARGCTTAEALYQSVAGPYQLLAVGDPLCRPWARVPRVSITGVKTGETVAGPIEISPMVVASRGNSIARIELFLDGLRVASRMPGENLTIDTTLLPDGAHELRVVAVEATPIATQGHAIVPFQVDNYGHAATLKLAEASADEAGRNSLNASCESADRIEIQANGRKIAELREAAGTITIERSELGDGPVRLQALGFDNQGKSIAASPIVALN